MRTPTLNERDLQVPGFIGEVMAHSLETAHCRNPVTSFAGALALQAGLAGTKVVGPRDVTANLAVLALSPTGTGKRHPHRVNSDLMHAADASHSIGGDVASPEALRDVLSAGDNVLFQYEEFGFQFRCGRRRQRIIESMLTKVNTRPGLSVFATGVPATFGEIADSPQGKRMLVLAHTGGRDSQRCDAPHEPPQDLVAWVRWWQARHSRTAVQVTASADRVLQRVAPADGLNAATVAAAEEFACKLATLYAVSAEPAAPQVDEVAATWGVRLALHGAATWGAHAEAAAL